MQFVHNVCFRHITLQGDISRIRIRIRGTTFLRNTSSAEQGDNAGPREGRDPEYPVVLPQALGSVQTGDHRGPERSCRVDRAAGDGDVDHVRQKDGASDREGGVVAGGGLVVDGRLEDHVDEKGGPEQLRDEGVSDGVGVTENVRSQGVGTIPRALSARGGGQEERGAQHRSHQLGDQVDQTLCDREKGDEETVRRSCLVSKGSTHEGERDGAVVLPAADVCT